MVKLTDVVASNARISTELPAGLVAVFAGGTSGIGEYSVLAFAKHARQPKVYLVGRSQGAADRIMAECRQLNPDGQYAFIAADASLLSNVDDVCRQLMEREKAINVLFLSIGSLDIKAETSEGLLQAFALSYYSRIRFVSNLLPQLQAAEGLRRVVNCFAGTKEGDVDLSDFGGRNMSMSFKSRGHNVSMATLALEELARTAPGVAFIHDYPGAVRSNIGRGLPAGLRFASEAVMAVLGPFIVVPNAESGERHVFLATSAMYPAGGRGGDGDGVAVKAGSAVAVARGTDGVAGSGVYTVDSACESGSPAVEQLLARLREGGVSDKVWAHTVGEFRRITGTPSLAAAA